MNSTRHLCAAFAFLAAMTFSLAAFGRSAVATFLGGPEDADGLPSASACAGAPASCDGNSVCSKTIPRYQNTRILGRVEYDPDTCKLLDTGQWTDASKALNPKDAGKFSTSVCTTKFSGTANCDGKPAKYNSVYFDWTLAKNSTGIPHEGPTVVFSSTWSSKSFTIPTTFHVSVPPVRPIGEKIEWKGFTVSHPPPNTAGAYGRWDMTLIPPQTPPENKAFDFTDEEIKESYVNARDECAERAPGILGSAGTTPPSKPASWKVGKLITDKGTFPAPKNVWGPDYTGLDACSIFAYRCAGATNGFFFNPLPCKLTLTQEIRIKSPADKDFTKDPVYTNSLGEGVGGSVHHYNITYYFGVAGSGPVFAKRMPLTGSSEGGGEFQAEYPDSARVCAAKPEVLGNLDVRYCLRPLVK